MLCWPTQGSTHRDIAASSARASVGCRCFAPGGSCRALRATAIAHLERQNVMTCECDREKMCSRCSRPTGPSRSDDEPGRTSQTAACAPICRHRRHRNDVKSRGQARVRPLASSGAHSSVRAGCCPSRRTSGRIHPGNCCVGRGLAAVALFRAGIKATSPSGHVAGQPSSECDNHPGRCGSRRLNGAARRCRPHRRRSCSRRSRSISQLLMIRE